ncbi:uncharacterized protein [Branchiostoma lanceolatum]|uniref:uncharacterized protein isoform X1 n=2 Tax=Branchiostoma lanceolatum TaxID=7740 RepID=UPI003453DB82
MAAVDTRSSFSGGTRLAGDETFVKLTASPRDGKMKFIATIAIIVFTTNGISGVAIPRQESSSTDARVRPTYDRCQYRPFSNLLSCQLGIHRPFEYNAVYPTSFGCSFTNRPVRTGQVLVPSDALEVDAERFAENTDVVTAVERAETVYVTETEIRETHHLHALGQHFDMAGGLTTTGGDEGETGGTETDESQTDETGDNAPEVRSRNDPSIPTCSLWRRIDSPIYAYSEETGTDQVELYFYEGNYQWFHLSSCHGSNPGPVVNCAGDCRQVRLQHRAVVVRPDLTAEWDWVWLDAGCTLHL